MDKTWRKPVIAGNWKMNGTPDRAAALVDAIKPLVASAACEVVVCPPFVCLPAALSAARGSNIRVGAQNMHWEKSGAFTGEVSAEMLTALGVSHVILGHSERRQYFAETDETVNKKVKSALSAGLLPIVCVGESLVQREAGETGRWVSAQTEAALSGLLASDLRHITMAYEPVWAIGTGRTATAEQADETIEVIRSAIAKLFGEEAARSAVILYGGSMNAGNAADLLARRHVDGGLIGGASLKPADFAAITAAASR